MTGVAYVLRVLSLLLAVALIALGALVVAEVVLAAFGRPPLVPYADVVASLRDSRWSSVLARAVAAGLAVLGLLLLVLALRRGKPATLPLVDGVDGVRASVQRRGLQRRLSADAARVDGVRRAKVRVGRRRVKVKAASGLRDTTGLAEQVEQRLQASLDVLALQRPLPLKVRTTRRTS